MVARIESAQFAQEVRPEAQIEVERLHRVNLRFETPPHVDPLIAVDPVTLRRVQVAAPGREEGKGVGPGPRQQRGPRGVRVVSR